MLARGSFDGSDRRELNGEIGFRERPVAKVARSIHLRHTGGENGSIVGGMRSLGNPHEVVEDCVILNFDSPLTEPLGGRLLLAAFTRVLFRCSGTEGTLRGIYKAHTRLSPTISPTPP